MVKELNQAKNTTAEFVVKMAGVIVWLTMVALGVYAVYMGQGKVSLTLCAIGLSFAGGVNIVASFFVLYRVLMHKG